MDLIDTRELRYFVTVAEERHFTRAAVKLHVAQPALSKTIRRLEGRLGVTLLRRTSRVVELTSAGEALLEHGRYVLSSLSLAVDAARRADDQHNLRLVIKPGGDANLLSGILAAFAGQPSARQVDIMFSGGVDRTSFLHEGRADVALLYVPFDDLTGLHAETLHVEDRVAVLPAGHDLAARAHVHSADLEDEQFPRWRAIPSKGDGPVLDELAELFPLVRICRVVAILPRSLVTPTPAGIVCVPVVDAEPSRIVVARRQNDHRRSVEAFMSAAVSAQH